MTSAADHPPSNPLPDQATSTVSPTSHRGLTTASWYASSHDGIERVSSKAGCFRLGGGSQTLRVDGLRGAATRPLDLLGGLASIFSVASWMSKSSRSKSEPGSCLAASCLPLSER
eukprot:scaffold58946_cov63-Phaeocystis_antarctica.AAC.13